MSQGNEPRSRRANIVPSMMLISLAIVGSALAGGPWEQRHKLLDQQGQLGDYFGLSIAVDGMLTIVGAPFQDDNGLSAGAAFVYDVETGKQIAKLLASDGFSQDKFGTSVAVAGNLAVVGADGRREPFSQSGTVYLFDALTGLQLGKLIPNDIAAHDFFGGSVAANGTLVLAGSRGHDGNGADCGAAYLFDAATGAQLFEFLATDAQGGDKLGYSVALGESLAVAGATGDDDNGADSGSAYVFDTSTGKQIAKIIPQDGQPGDAFGYSVAVNGNLVLVGAFLDDDNGTDSGSAYLFDGATGKQLAKFLPDDGQSRDQFGRSVAISGDFAVIGAPLGDGAVTNSGAVYVFDTSTGQQVVKLAASDGNRDDFFGVSVGVQQDHVAIGSAQDDDVNPDAGSAYLWHHRTTDLLTVFPDPLIAGGNGAFVITKADPDSRTWLLVSLQGAGGFFSRSLNIVVDLQNPHVAAGPRRTDANGNFRWILPIPDSAAGFDVWLQSVQFGNKTNVVARQIIQ